jgi:hypothetical protein
MFCTGTPGRFSDRRENRGGWLLKSRVPGRDRWMVPAISDDRNRAVTLETLLRSEPGIRRVSASEITGRVLIEYSPQEIETPIERLIERAVAFGPMLPGESQVLRRRHAKGASPLRLLISAELGCLLFKLAFASFAYPGIGAAAGIAFTVAALCRSNTRTETPVPATAVRVKADQPG